MIGGVLLFDDDGVGSEFFKGSVFGLEGSEGGEAGGVGGESDLLFSDCFEDFATDDVLNLWLERLWDFDVRLVRVGGFWAEEA